MESVGTGRKKIDRHSERSEESLFHCIPATEGFLAPLGMTTCRFIEDDAKPDAMAGFGRKIVLIPELFLP
jgi:hypothetical protein